MANLKQSIVVVALLFTTVYGLTIGGDCPDVKPIDNFSPIRYLGKWYEYGKYDYVFEILGKCITADYGLLANGNISIVNSEVNELTGWTTKINGSAHVEASGQLSVEFPLFSQYIGKADYQILGTDYINYAVVWSCNKTLGGLYYTKVLWILTRHPFPTKEVLKEAKAVITKNNLSLEKLTITNQFNCPTNY